MRGNRHRRVPRGRHRAGVRGVGSGRASAGSGRASVRGRVSHPRGVRSGRASSGSAETFPGFPRRMEAALHTGPCSLALSSALDQRRFPAPHPHTPGVLRPPARPPSVRAAPGWLVLGRPNGAAKSFTEHVSLQIFPFFFFSNFLLVRNLHLLKDA